MSQDVGFHRKTMSIVIVDGSGTVFLRIFARIFLSIPIGQ